MKDWQAALAAYIIALLIAETEAAPIAVVGAWAIAIEQLLETLGTNVHPIADLLGTQATTQIPVAPGTTVTIPANPTPVPVQGIQGTVP